MEYTKSKNRGNTLEKRKGAWYTCIRLSSTKYWREMMREIEFKMERPGLLQEGDVVHVTEGVLPSNYYYTIDPSLAMSGNFPFRERLLAKEGKVLSVIENERGFYVKVAFEE